MKTIDIYPYGRPHPMHNERYFVDAAHGKEVAEKTKLLEAVQAGNVDIVCKTENTSYGYGGGNNVGESFVRGFIGPTARAVGIDEFIRKVKVNGLPVDGLTWAGWFQRNVASYLQSEKKRLVRDAKEKARETNGGVWSKPTCLMVPGISTVMKLVKDWKFRLHRESRNNDMLALFGESSSWEKANEVAGEVTMKAGSELSVNRVYIRQGADEFSSYTFYLKKGAELEMGGKKTVSRGKVRFWAKLGDVNTMQVVIDTNTLAEN